MTQRARILVFLVALSALNQLDRQLTSVLLEPIRQEFALSDVQLGLLSGLAFAILYAGLSIPAAIAAVHVNRRNLIAASAAVWGGMTFLSGIAHSYWALLAARIGVGLGEAGAMPASHAVISDLYEPHERSGALAAWSAGVNIGIFLAFLLGGTIGQIFGWRAAFLGAGLTTMVTALLVARLVAEPTRAADAEHKRWRASASWPLMHETAKRIASDRPLRHVLFGSTLTAIAGYGDMAWAPSFFIRAHGLSLTTVGVYLATVVGVLGAAGAMIGGRLVDRFERRHAAGGFVAIAIACVIVKPFALICYLEANTGVALTTFIPPALVGTLFVGPSLATLHSRIAPTLRPAGSALFLMMVNLIGLGLGPLLIGAMSQWLFTASDPHSLGYAMAIMQVIGLWGSAHFFVAGKFLGVKPLQQAAPVAHPEG